ncbi:MAG: septal ring lytic transglycosylase RlpA family protein [Gammaproteobacteria bacterium]|nr:MAG: septal ring lytic transglycosylase RlpA family protein [Gammaproteobacteria bacterium]
MIRHAICFLIAVLILSGCSTTRRGGYYQDDGPHTRTPSNLSEVKEPVPVDEPLSKSGNKPYVVFGKTYYPLMHAQGYRKKGVASWYGKKFHGKPTSSGERYNMYKMSAAHKTLPLPSFARITNLKNDKSIIVRVNDRGPFLHNRLIDLSYAAADRLGIIKTGTGLVEVEALTADTGTTTTIDTPVAAHTDARLFLQVGAFGERSNALRMKQVLQDMQIPSVFIQDISDNQHGVFRVRIGPLQNIAESDRISERLRSQGIREAHIIVE